ncbi:hypothetical protein [Alsobacter sp. R-9]
MPIPLHSHFRITDAAIRQYKSLADEYRAAGFEPIIASIAWGTVILNSGKSSERVVVGYYCADELKGVPVAEIGEISGLTCVFFVPDDLKPRFWNRTLDWNDREGWHLR